MKLWPFVFVGVQYSGIMVIVSFLYFLSFFQVTTQLQYIEDSEPVVDAVLLKAAPAAPALAALQPCITDLPSKY